eukprot:scaffold2557_cov121-Cylindrotheca_fusiformis.AAC.13
MSNNPHVIGPRHNTLNSPEKQRCSKLYKQETFRDALRASSPHLRALERLYEVGVTVNRYQREELKQCAAVQER